MLNKYRNKQIFQPFLAISLLFLLIVLPSCYAMRSGATKSGKKLYESFYLGEGSMQYFIKPLRFKAIDSDDELLIDFTFRQGDLNSENSVANLSWMIDSPENKPGPEKHVDSLILHNNFATAVSKEIKFLFNSRVKGNYHLRLSAVYNHDDMINFLFKEGWKVVLYNEGKEFIFNPIVRTNKSLLKLKESELTAL